MKLFSKKALITLGLVVLAPMTASAATVNLNAQSNTISNPVELYLQAGTYNVDPFKDAYTSWNAWGSATGCDNTGTHCKSGWINNYSFTTPTETIHIKTSDDNRYATAELALENAISTSFTLLSAATVKFFINDNKYDDNLGGMSLNVSAVPVPAAAFLFAPALLGFVGLRRKAQKSVA